MYKNILESVEGIVVYPIISLIIFFIFFVLLIIWVFKVDKKYLNKMSMLPLDISTDGAFDTDNSNTKENSNIKGN